MKLYLAHPILIREQVRQWELGFEERTGIELVNAFFENEANINLAGDDWPTRIVEGDFRLLDACDGIIAIIPLTVTTVGTPMEIQHQAEHCPDKPIFVVTQGIFLKHPWLTYYRCKTVATMREFEEMVLPCRLAFVGRMGDGKTSAADWLVKERGFTKYSFADKLKEIATDLFGMKEKDRKLLQKLGTDAIRSQFPTAWIDYLVRTIQEEDANRVVVDDCRFDNEAVALRAQGFKIVRIVKVGERKALGLTEETAHHSSETEQATIQADFVVEASNLSELYYELEEFIDSDISSRVSSVDYRRAGLEYEGIYFYDPAHDNMGGQNILKDGEHNKDVKYLIAECEKRLKDILARLEADPGTKDARFYTDAFTKVVGTLAKLYELRGEEVSKLDVVRLLSKVEALPEEDDAK